MIRLDFTGYIGHDAILRDGKDGVQYASFSVATKISKDTSQWVDCFKRDPDGRYAAMLKKSKRIYVSGKPKLGLYTRTGETIPTITVFVDTFELQEKKPETAPNTSEIKEVEVFPKRPEGEAQPEQTPIPANEDDGDLPF